VNDRESVDTSAI